jgi:hypothetical protein
VADCEIQIIFQVSTETGIMIYYYNVSVIVPDTSIVGGSEYHVDMGSAIQLTCIIRNVIDPSYKLS